MKINKIQVNAFGKLKNANIELKNGINIINGDNEAGKSTLLSFITSIFYGLSTKKRGKEITDYDRFTPWEGEAFSGKIDYELDNGKKFEVYREFNNKTTQIFNENMEDISKEFNIDKSNGNEFFKEQTNVDEDLFKSTVLVSQQEVKLENADQHMLIQKISNLVGTGEDKVSYKLAMDRLNRKLLDEVGTKTSRTKPINLLTNEIEEMEQKLEELEQYSDLKYEIEETKTKLQGDLVNLERELSKAKEIKVLKDKQELENEKLKIKQDVLDKDITKLKELKDQLFEVKAQEKSVIEKNRKVNIKIKGLKNRAIVILVALIILNILQFIFIKNHIINYACLLVFPVLFAYYFLSKKTESKKIDNKSLREIKEEKDRTETELSYVKENKEKLEAELNEISKNIEQKDEINVADIDEEIEKIQNDLNEKRLKIHEQDLNQKNIEPQLDNLSNLEEKLGNDKEKYQELKNKEASIELAKEVLTQAYEQMKEEVTPKFTSELSKNIEEITKGKYNKAMYNEEQGLIVELQDGNKKPAHVLSVGTIDQLYLSLRLSMIDDLSPETLPIILDESFAYYDNKRLENILAYLAEKHSNRQIIIFTCTNREKEALENANIEFQYIEMA